MTTIASPKITIERIDFQGPACAFLETRESKLGNPQAIFGVAAQAGIGSAAGAVLRKVTITALSHGEKVHATTWECKSGLRPDLKDKEEVIRDAKARGYEAEWAGPNNPGKVTVIMKREPWTLSEITITGRGLATGVRKLGKEETAVVLLKTGGHHPLETEVSLNCSPEAYLEHIWADLSSWEPDITRESVAKLLV